MYFAKPSLTFVADWKHKLLIVTPATLLLVYYFTGVPSPNMHTPCHSTLSLHVIIIVTRHGAFLGTFRFVGLYKKVLYTIV